MAEGGRQRNRKAEYDTVKTRDVDDDRSIMVKNRYQTMAVLCLIYLGTAVSVFVLTATESTFSVPIYSFLSLRGVNGSHIPSTWTPDVHKRLDGYLGYFSGTLAATSFLQLAASLPNNAYKFNIYMEERNNVFRQMESFVSTGVFSAMLSLSVGVSDVSLLCVLFVIGCLIAISKCAIEWGFSDKARPSENAVDHEKRVYRTIFYWSSIAYLIAWAIQIFQYAYAVHENGLETFITVVFIIVLVADIGKHTAFYMYVQEDRRLTYDKYNDWQEILTFIAKQSAVWGYYIGYRQR